MAVEAFKSGLGRRARAVGSVLRSPPAFPPGHFYSPHTSASDRTIATWWGHSSPVGVDLHESDQIELFEKISTFMSDLREDRRYSSDPEINLQFGRPDAAVLHGMLRHFRPERYVEIGSGFSTAVALDAAEDHLDGLRITCVEPYPDRLLSRLKPDDPIVLERRPVQSLDARIFEELHRNDVLFIDSTHVVKSGSDVVYLMLHILPLLAPGVLVHIHDIHWPFEYPAQWLNDRRDWNEVYLVRALLSGSARWRIRLMSSWVWATRPQTVPPAFAVEPNRVGSLWIQAQ